jgi:hypothetical protein
MDQNATQEERARDFLNSFGGASCVPDAMDVEHLKTGGRKIQCHATMVNVLTLVGKVDICPEYVEDPAALAFWFFKRDVGTDTNTGCPLLFWKNFDVFSDSETITNPESNVRQVVHGFEDTLCIDTYCVRATSHLLFLARGCLVGMPPSMKHVTDSLARLFGCKRCAEDPLTAIAFQTAVTFWLTAMDQCDGKQPDHVSAEHPYAGQEEMPDYR